MEKSLQIEYRSAEPGDIEGMVGLLEILFSVEEDFEFNPEVHRRALGRIIELPGERNLVLVATDPGSGIIAGMLTVQTVISTATGELSGWVEDVVVHPRFQGQGLGTELLARAEAWASNAGVNRLQLLADRNNGRALEFYSSRGWTASNMVHRKKMIPPETGGITY